MIVIIDHYDSFVYNLARYFQELNQQVCVLRYDQVNLNTLKNLSMSALVLSPGPQGPEQAQQSVEYVRHLSGQVPILGICLGHQIIGAAFDLKVQKLDHPFHGVSSLIFHGGRDLFQGLDHSLEVGRYHSLVVCDPKPTDPLIVQARDENGLVMALGHRHHLTYGFQFHPESILTSQGHDLLKNFLLKVT